MNKRLRTRRHNYELDQLKSWFIQSLIEKDYDKETIRNFENFMYRIRGFEMLYTEPKLINEYNYDELITFLKSLGSSSQASLVIYVNMIRKFFLFCIQQGKMDDSIDFTRTIDYNTLVRCVDNHKNKHRYITEKEFNKSLDNLVNSTDRGYLQLIFEGVVGKEYSEILNIKEEDVDLDNNTIDIKNEDGTLNRVVNISDGLADTINEIMDTDIIYHNNVLPSCENDGDMSFKKEVCRVDNLAMSEYLFKPTERFLGLKATKEKIERGEYNGRQVDGKTVSNRLFKILKSWCELEYVSPNTLYRSGVVNRAIKCVGIEADKQTFAEWVANNEGYSLCVAYKMYPVYKEIVEQIKEE